MSAAQQLIATVMLTLATFSLHGCGGGGGHAGPKHACNLTYVPADSSPTPPFSGAELEQVRSYFFRNIDIGGVGAVVAAPDHNTGPGGDYYFHWERDGALTMEALMKTTPNILDVDVKLKHYVQWVTKVQNQPDPHGIDIRVEPKYTIPDGRPFGGPWCRPQNDGPALRARTLSLYGLEMLKKGELDYVSTFLWPSQGSGGGPVKHDLDWVVANWKMEGCDLWEEIRSDDFFWNRYTMRAGLHFGANLAEKMGDLSSAARYRTTKGEIESTLMKHFDGNFVYESENRRKDAAVIEAFNVGDLGDGVFSPLCKEVLGTVITLNELFCESFAINQKDSAANIPGILYGRYEGDTYNGGNPWVLLSATLAQLMYRQAIAVVKNPGSVTPEIHVLLRKAYGIKVTLIDRPLGDALLGAGDGVMMRIKHHVLTTGLHMAEQIGRNDGKMTSAKDLTWNYADVLKAISARDEYVALRRAASSSGQTQTVTI